MGGSRLFGIITLLENFIFILQCTFSIENVPYFFIIWCRGVVVKRDLIADHFCAFCQLFEIGLQYLVVDCLLYHVPLRCVALLAHLFA